ncbi:hypothetical protein CFIICLFH_2857 [Methylobacterium goesingense]|nr:hypothetical protein CFIICLFH_2857 [Methylobacterium goesingense]
MPASSDPRATRLPRARPSYALPGPAPACDMPASRVTVIARAPGARPCMSDRDLAWLVGIHMVFVVSGLLMALTDRLIAGHHDR